MKKQLRGNRICRQKGNTLLEAVLFTPLALFFLFVVTDAGLFLYERSALANAFRAGVSTQVYHSKRSPLYIDPYNEIRVDPAVLEDVLNGVVKEVADAVSRVKTPINRNDFKVRARGVVFDINKETGALLRYRVRGKAESSGTFNLQTAAPCYPYISKHKFLEKRIEKARSIVPSSFAIASGPVFQPQTGDVVIPFHDTSLAIYVELTVLTNGLARSAVKSSLGEYFAIQEQGLALARLQNG